MRYKQKSAFVKLAFDDVRRRKTIGLETVDYTMTIPPPTQKKTDDRVLPIEVCVVAFCWHPLDLDHLRLRPSKDSTRKPEGSREDLEVSLSEASRCPKKPWCFPEMGFAESQKPTQITTCGRSTHWFYRGWWSTQYIVGFYIAVINIKRYFLWFSKPIPLAVHENSATSAGLPFPREADFQVWRIMSPRWIPRSCGTIVLILPVAYGVTLCFSIRKKTMTWRDDRKFREREGCFWWFLFEGEDFLLWPGGVIENPVWERTFHEHKRNRKK